MKHWYRLAVVQRVPEGSLDCLLFFYDKGKR